MSLIRDLNALIDQRQGRTLPAVKNRGGLKGQASTATHTPRKSNTAGIASPLTEKTKVGTVKNANGVDEQKNMPDREYYPSGNLSSDGLFVLPSIKTMTLTDANGEEVILKLADPSGTAIVE